MIDYSSFVTPLPHPGEHLREEFLPRYHLTAGALAKRMGLKDRTRIERIIREKQPITADTALRLAPNQTLASMESFLAKAGSAVPSDRLISRTPVARSAHAGTLSLTL